MKRRKFLTGLAGGSLASLSGCTASAGTGIGGAGSGGSVPTDVAWPAVRETAPGWQLTNMSEDQINRSELVTVYARTHEYANKRLRRNVREKTLGQFDSPLAKFFATHLGLRGVGTELAGVSTLAGPIGKTLKTEMQNIGLKNVQSVPPGEIRPQIEDAVIKEYHGEYEVPAIKKTINLSDVPEKRFELPPKRVTFAGFVAVWKADKGSAYAGGGVVPAQDYEQSGTFSLTSETGDGIDLSVSVDLNFPVEEVRKDVVRMVESIE